ncbi:four helix bundle protein [Lusitaniella coriacea LEGE 07157]|uniref:Four helix bundle protein n=1 Tax=Lusitaniella coriacea LEGE 07157 TaxID=945747 RepID=A0A8J7JC54_9CYAN|nr:four helix bundle protein [Lusitaniella coriacea]MBE9117210.1 four helix bundle protein [Lusitaniella coriacea LEGE 07157]
MRSYQNLHIYQLASEVAKVIFELFKKFPVEEKDSLTAPIRHASHSVCANLAEAWEKRHDEATFIAQLNDCEAKAAGVQTWIDFAFNCNYLDRETSRELQAKYNQILSGLVSMANKPASWLMKPGNDSH